VDVLNITVVYIGKNYQNALRAIKVIERSSSQDFYAPILQAAKDIVPISKKISSISSFKADQPDTDSFWETFQEKVDNFINVIDGVERASWPDKPERNHFLEIKKFAKDERETYFQDFRGHHIWLFFNFYHPYNPFYFRSPDGSYVVQPQNDCEKGINFESSAVYFMVSKRLFISTIFYRLFFAYVYNLMQLISWLAM
jgi:hypothetical protein